MRNTAIFLFILICSSLFYSCASETEQKGLDKIVELYGGSVSITKGVRASTEKGSGKYMEINMNNPSVMETDVDNSQGIILNSIYLVYSNQTPEERAKYDAYEGKIEYQGKSFTLEASNTLLKTIHQNVESVITTSKMISDNNFEKATIYFHPVLKELAPADTLSFLMKPITDSLQTVKETFLVGIYVSKEVIEQINPNETDYLIYTVKQLCQNGDRFFYYRIYPNPKSKKNIIFLKSNYNYKQTE